MMKGVVLAEHWYQKAAEMMVAQGISLFAATQDLDLGVRKAECDEIAKSKDFLDILRGERNRFYKTLASDPARSRNTAVGQLLYVIERLIDSEQWDKAANAITQLAKMEGWSSDQAAQNVFLDLSGKDLTQLREKFKSQQPTRPN